jgi:glycosyltransferase involved in cell wall biosynthesis
MKKIGYSQNDPKISVITPNYNYGHFIGRTIESVIGQDYDNLEHIVVDDGSTDNSVDIIKKYVEEFPGKVRLIRQENKGQAAAINTGLKNITGDIIAWINSDDWYCDNVFGKIIKEFHKNPQIDLVYGPYYNVDTEGRKRFLYKDIKFSYFMACMVGFGQMMASSTVFWKVGLQKKAGYLDESFSYAMDNEYFSRLTKDAAIKRVRFPVAVFRYHPQSKTSIHKTQKVERYSEEMRLVSQRAYNSLSISRIVPYKHVGIIRVLFRLYRVIVRTFSGHYIPKIKYRLKSIKPE